MLHLWSAVTGESGSLLPLPEPGLSRDRPMWCAAWWPSDMAAFATL